MARILSFSMGVLFLVTLCRPWPCRAGAGHAEVATATAGDDADCTAPLAEVDESTLSLLAVDQKVASKRGQQAKAPREPLRMLTKTAHKKNGTSPKETTLLQAPAAATTRAAVPAFSFRASCAEFFAMTLFVWVGCGAAMSIAKQEGSAWVLQVSLAFGFAITVLAYAIGHYSGGQINGAVTLSLWVSGKIGFGQLIVNVIFQLLGSVLGAFILERMYGAEKDCTGGLGTNSVADGWSKTSALIGEVMGTFLLVYVVHETAVNPLGSDNLTLAPLAIGLSVFLAHCVLIPIDGCSINPTRSFGPALVCSIFRKGSTPFRDMWVFTIGPIAGALLASLVYYWMRPAF